MDLKKIASFIGALFIINKGLDVALVDYKLKNNRFVARDGYIKRNKYVIDYDDIVGLKKKKKPLDYLLGTHTIEVYTDSTVGENHTFRYVPDPMLNEINERINSN